MTPEERLAQRLNLNPADIEDLKWVNAPGIIPEDETLMEYTYKGTQFITNGKQINMPKKAFEFRLKQAFQNLNAIEIRS